MLTSFLIGVLYCEFDNHHGPKITHQSPADAFSDAEFDEIAKFIIPKSELNGRVSHLCVSGGHSILYYCHQVNADYYPRHKFTFTLAFVFRSDTPDNIVRPFREPLRKVVTELVSLEQMGCLLFRQSTQWADLPEEGVNKLPSITSLHHLGHFNMANVVKVLHASLREPPYECVLALSESRVVILNARPTGSGNDVSAVHLWSVPIKVRPMNMLESSDIFLIDVMRSIDGKTHALGLARRLQADPQWFLRTLQHLVYSGFVEALDIFQFSNRYTVTEKFATFAAQATRETMTSFVSGVVDMQSVVASRRGPSLRDSLRTSELPEVFTLPGFTTWERPTPTLHPPNTEEGFSCCMWLLAKFSPSGLTSSPYETISDRMATSRDPSDGNCWRNVAPFVNTTKLIKSAVIVGLLRRVHEYPELKPQGLVSTTLRDHIEGKVVSVGPFLNGEHSMDELCVRFMTPRVQLLQEWKDHVNVVMR